MLAPLLATLTLLHTARGAAVQPQLPFVAPSASSASSGRGDVGEPTEWNVLHHLSGISPYFSHGPNPSPPEGCDVVNVAMIARHGS